MIAQRTYIHVRVGDRPSVFVRDLSVALSRGGPGGNTNYFGVAQLNTILAQPRHKPTPRRKTPTRPTINHQGPAPQKGKPQPNRGSRRPADPMMPPLSLRHPMRDLSTVTAPTMLNDGVQQGLACSSVVDLEPDIDDSSLSDDEVRSRTSTLEFEEFISCDASASDLVADTPGTAKSISEPHAIEHFEIIKRLVDAIMAAGVNMVHQGAQVQCEVFYAHSIRSVIKDRSLCPHLSASHVSILRDALYDMATMNGSTCDRISRLHRALGAIAAECTVRVYASWCMHPSTPSLMAEQ